MYEIFQIASHEINTISNIQEISEEKQIDQFDHSSTVKETPIELLAALMKDMYEAIWDQPIIVVEDEPNQDLRDRVKQLCLEAGAYF